MIAPTKIHALCFAMPVPGQCSLSLELETDTATGLRLMDAIRPVLLAWCAPPPPTNHIPPNLTATRQPKPSLAQGKLAQAMAAKGMSASDLARAVYGTTEDKRGRKVANGRDRISQYLHGKIKPEPDTIAKLADALGVAPDYLTAGAG